MGDLDAEVLRLEAQDLALDGGPVADEDDGRAELADRGHRALHDDGGAAVAPHGVNGDLHRAWRLTAYVPSTATISRPL